MWDRLGRNAGSGWRAHMVCTGVTGPITCLSVRLPILLIILLMASPSQAGIRWRSQPVPVQEADTPAKTADQLRQSVETLRFAAPEGAVLAGTRHVVVEFVRPVTPTERVALEQAGLSLLTYLGDDAFFAALSIAKSDAEAIVASAPLADVQAVRREWKLHPVLQAGTPPDWSIVPAPAAAKTGVPGEVDAVARTHVAVYVLLHPDVTLRPDGVNLCQRHGGVIRAELASINGLVVEMPLASVAALADEDGVQWVEPPLPRMEDLNDSARVVSQAETAQQAPYGLTGAGVTVLLYDGGAAWPGHADLGGRLTVRDRSPLSSHATHVAGTIGGDGTVSQGLYRGMAPGVTIASYGFEYDGSGTFLYTNPGDIEADYNEAINIYGAMIANNSIGTNTARNGFPCEYEGDYGVTSMLIDAIVRGSLGSPMRIIWANGNERSSGRCGQFYHTTAPPSCAKNHIAVGAIHSNDDAMTWFSSWGPSDDGRLRPDIVAPGCQSDDDRGVTSLGTDGKYSVLCGTSMATPVVTGLGALLLEEWHHLHPGMPLPRNSMLKALLAHTAADLGMRGPDYTTGYGSARVSEAVDQLRSGSYREESLDHGQSRFYLVQVPAGTASLKATLAWDDPPGAANTIPELVNDLDVVAIAPTGQVVYYPWTLEPNQPDAPAVRVQPDRLNNLEQVLVDAPLPGAWLIRVNGYSIPAGPQTFSVVVTPSIVSCSSAGTVALNAENYGCDADVLVTVNDCDLNLDPQIADVATVTLASTSEPVGLEVLCTEVGPDTGAFVGTAILSAASEPGRLLVQDGDALTADYLDADDGEGRSRHVQASASVDCAPPSVVRVTVTTVAALRASIEIETDEPTRAALRYGNDCGDLDQTALDAATRTLHTFTLTGLVPDRRYLFVVDVADPAGNATTDDNAGLCHSFITPDAPDYFTHAYLENEVKPSYLSLLFTPNGTLDYYAVCAEPVTALPVDPVGGTWTKNVTEITLPGGVEVSLYGTRYNKFWINTSGSVTFTNWDSSQTSTLQNHFSLPRIAPLLAWVYPVEKGFVSWKQLPDRIVVTWEHISDAATGNPSTCQVEMFFDGRLRMSWLGVGSSTPVCGLSRGTGIQADYVPSDLSGYVACVADGLNISPHDPFSSRGVVGGPFSPECHGYTLTNHTDPPALLSWSSQTTVSWLEVMPSSGTLPPGGSVEVQVCLNAAADALSASAIDYIADVAFANITTNVTQRREVQLAVAATRPPVAYDVLAKTPAGVAVEITLTAADDGHPPASGSLVYSVVSPPGHGQLSDDDSDEILIYTPQGGFSGIDTFTYRANDGGIAPNGGNSNVATVTVRVVGMPTMPALPTPSDGALDVPVATDILSADTSDPSLLRVAIAAAAYPTGLTSAHFTDPQAKLTGTGRFNSVALIDTGKVTPTLTELQAFDGVIVWSNDQFYDPASFGDRLADYVDGGGGVVLAVFGNVSVRSYGGIAGRFLNENYMCIWYPNNTLPPMGDRPQLTLGSTWLPAHPTAAQIVHFDGGPRSFRAKSSYLSDGAVLVANWTDGVPLIVAREVNGTPRVDLGMFPPSTGAGYDFWVAGTDGDLILANALAHASSLSGCATLYDVYFGTDNPPATIIGTGLPVPQCPPPATLDYGQTYYWRVVARNLAGTMQGPVWPFSTAPVAAAEIMDSVPAPDDHNVDFGTTALGTTRTEQITICNQDAAEDLLLTDVRVIRAPLYEEDFDDAAAQDWLPVPANDWTFVRGSYQGASQVSNSRIQSTYTGGTWQDGSIRVRMTRTDSPYTAAGVAFRASDDFDWINEAGSAYLVAISGTGQYYVGRFLDGEFSFIGDWASSSRLKGYTGDNNLVVNVVGEQIEIYVNGWLIWSGVDTTISGPGRIAFIAYTNPPGSQNTEHFFDDFEVGLPLPIVLPGGTQTSLLLQGPPSCGTALSVPPKDEEDEAGLVAELLAAVPAIVVPDPTEAFQLAGVPSLPAVLSPSLCATFDVSFDPRWLGQQAGRVRMVGNSAAGSNMDVHLSGTADPAYLAIVPEETFIATGPEGGPFTPPCTTYTLINTGPTPLAWSATTAATWWQITPSSGSIPPSSSQVVDVCITSQANSFLAGNYTVTITITDQGTGIGQKRDVSVAICPLPPVPINPNPSHNSTGWSVGAPLAWNGGVVESQVCHQLNKAEIGYVGSNQRLATVCSVDVRQMLLGIKMKLAIQGTANLHYFVASSPDLRGPFMPVFEKVVTVSGTGTSYYASGTIHVILEPDLHYTIGVAWGDEAIGYGLHHRAYPVGWPLGAIEGGLAEYGPPPVRQPLSGFDGTAAVPVELCVNKIGCVTYDVYLGEYGLPAKLVCQDAPEPVCLPAGELLPDRLYQWRVVAGTPCGSRQSSTWAFATGPCGENPPLIDTASGRRPVSRMTHGIAGDFDVDLLGPGGGAIAVEGRQGGPVRLVITFTRPMQGVGGLDPADVSLLSSIVGLVPVTNLTLDGATLTIELASLPEGRLTLSFPGLADANNASCLVPETLCFAVLPGDVNGDEEINISDMIAVRYALNAGVDSTRFRCDVIHDGRINIFDLIAIRNNLGHRTAPPCP